MKTAGFIDIRHFHTARKTASALTLLTDGEVPILY